MRASHLIWALKLAVRGFQREIRNGPLVEAVTFDLSATLASKFKDRLADTKSAGIENLKEKTHFPEVVLALIIS